MKRILTLAVLVISIQIAAALPNSAILHLQLQDNAPLQVLLDGRQMPVNGTAGYWNDLKAGRHTLQVYRINNGWGFLNATTVYRGTIDLAGNTESYVTVLNGRNQIKFDRIVAIEPISQAPESPQVFFDPRLPVNPGPTHHNHHGHLPQQGPVAMSNAEFQQFINTVHHSSFESTRLSIVQQALQYNYVTTAQVCQLMDEFWFDNTRLEVAKLAYPKTVDPNHYYQVNNSFTFSSSVNDLSDFLAMR